MRRSRSNVVSGSARNRAVYPDAPVKLIPRVLRPAVRQRTFLQEVEDRRVWHPLRERAPAGVFSRREERRLVERDRRSSDPFPSLRLGFAVPEKVAVCVRRKTRREVIHALNKAGGGVSRKRRRNEYSDIRC